ncbi:tRNA-uridine aminocarboxypropyltransferase [Shewanella salipaludis]|uniref:tRNA-uridine aminocarboxypropyltransferase n=1 Tax=Shewanella salipaludis TaxID=2723052 RepID=A0A972FRC0_9GAMM|nr:DTW domain-containing protein [Shewanella salipaludis]NMH63844.1 DTW domain-containing protein [Shewanella salipaludis]
MAAAHSVHRLYQHRKALSTKPYGARGKNLVRCQQCLMGQAFCICSHRKPLLSGASFLLIMYDDEVLKPSNSGRLIADLIPDTHAFIWSRTQIAPELLAILQDPQYRPYLVFPGEYAHPDQPVLSRLPAPRAAASGTEPATGPATDSAVSRPLFVMLDGSWREAIKMFRKSPYLQHLPMLSFDAGTVAAYALRKGSRDFQFGTAEVAAMALAVMGEAANARALNAWFDLFIETSLLCRNRRNHAQLQPLTEYIEAFEQAHATAQEAHALAR